MKKICFVVILLVSIFVINEVDASNEFYVAEKVEGVFVGVEYGDYTASDELSVIRNSSTGSVAYCLEPMVYFKNGIYNSSVKPEFVSEDTWERISLLAYYGYEYGNHTDIKWFSLTQAMIWQEVLPDGVFYYMDSYWGNVVDPYAKERDELNKLVDSHLLKPSFDGDSIDLVLGDKVVIEDTNKKLINYRTNYSNGGITIMNNTMTINAYKEGNYTVSLSYPVWDVTVPSIYYYSDNSQDIVSRGYPVVSDATFNYNVVSTKLTINKLDSESLSSENIYDSLLEGAVYHIYRNDNTFYKEIVIDEDKMVTIDNVPFGDYYIREISAGYGYQVDDNIYEFTISDEVTEVVLNLTNVLIKKEITINKTYSDGVNSAFESNISFNVYDEDMNLINTIITDENGYASILLSYGTYLIKQVNTTEGYMLVEDFYVTVNNDISDYTYDLIDFKIPVPDTGASNVIMIERLVCLIDKKYSFFFI